MRTLDGMLASTPGSAPARHLPRLGLSRGPAQIVFGRGTVTMAGELARSCGTRALVCTDGHIHSSAGFSRLEASLTHHGLEFATFAGVEAEVPLHNIGEAVDLARSFRPDLVVAIGGGSSIDLAKLVSLELSHPGPIERYYGDSKVPGPVLPVVAIPTTAGTGSEVTPVAVLTDPRRTMKVGVSSPRLMPRFAVCDPELTDTCPPSVTAHAGIDALAHAIESFTAVVRAAEPGLLTERVFIGKNRLSDVYALAAIREIHPALVRACQDGADEAARDHMALGSLLAGLALGSAGTAAAHALQYPIGAATKTPHGLGVGILLQYAMPFNWPAAPDAFAEIGWAMGCDESSPEVAGRWAIDEVARLCAAIGIPRSLQDLGVREPDLPAFAEQASTISRLVANNPRDLDVPALNRILTAAWTGSSGGLEGSLDRSDP
jgi:alcohol dehydrogenase class IV